MARQEISLGTAPTGVGGDTTRTTGVKINQMTTEIYSVLGQLGSASTRSVGTASGNVLEYGAFGLGAAFDLVLAIDMDNGFQATHTGWYRYSGSTTSGRPTFGSGYGTFMQLSGTFDATGGYGAQLAFDYIQTEVGFRAFRGGSGASAWCKLYHTGNTTRAADGTLKAI